MNTKEYRLKSNPEKSIEVPLEYATQAEALVQIAKESPRILRDSISDHPYLSNLGVLTKTVQLAVLARDNPNSKKLPKLEDEVYLRVCIYGIQRKMDDGGDFQELHSDFRELTALVESLS